LTDLPELIELAQINIEANRHLFPHGSVSAETFAWDQQNEKWNDSQFDFILASDVVYSTEQSTGFSHLIKALLTLSSKQSQILLAYKKRYAAKEKPFWDEAVQFSIKQVYSDVDIEIHHLTLK